MATRTFRDIFSPVDGLNTVVLLSDVIVEKWQSEHILTTYFWLKRCKISHNGVFLRKTHCWMKRDIYDKLLKWKNDPFRKPLVIEGARQIGKSWILEEFAKREYENYILIDFKKDRNAGLIFQSGFDMPGILQALQIKSGIRPEPSKTLIIFDEFQEAKGCFEVLKYFRQDCPEYHVAVAGSLLGITLHRGESFPVGQCNILKMYPMSFLEYLEGTDRQPLRSLIESRNWKMIAAFKDELTAALREYYFVGGMPEAVSIFVATRDLEKVRQVQTDIIEGYDNDFSKHAAEEGVDPMKIRLVYESLPAQLAKENRKFVYGVVRTGARARTFESAIQWLVDSGIVHKVTRVTKPGLPLSFYEDKDSFKLYFVDCGLLSCMSRIPAGMIMGEKSPLVEFKGMIAEQYVLQQLLATSDCPVHYWSKENSTAEIEFIVQTDKAIVPVEVKSSANVRSTSLKNMLSANPDLRGVRFSLKDADFQERLDSVPLYAAPVIFAGGATVSVSESGE